ncbi:GAP family protein [Mycobacterium sp. Aquia_213]|uniref:GAP family protein n=1 Tax=Mycobacterium sp. Aquia_213 TaxID=2991728 RepID=UPI00226FCE0A|nr:GAP family protein [Mycobacterium sp. Aquia_213]WAC89725.1 GAP family protein [Mycobacterium sp. Aquia_213]
MEALLLALAGLAFLDSLNVLNVGVVSAVVYASRLDRRSPLPGGLSFVVGLFAITTTFGVCTVLGLGFLTHAVDFKITPALRFWGQLLLGVVLMCLAYFPLTAQTSAPGWALAAMRQRPWLLGILGAAIGTGQAPTSIPYLTGLAMLAALHPRPPMWPLLIYVYWTLALTPSLVILFLATRKTTRAVRIQRAIVRGLTRYGPISVRILFLVVGVGLVADALLFRSVLW